MHELQKSFKTTMGETNHLRHTTECEKIQPAGKFENRFPDCNRVSETRMNSKTTETIYAFRITQKQRRRNPTAKNLHIMMNSISRSKIYQHAPEESIRQYPSWEGEQRKPTEEVAEEKQQERNNTPGGNVDENGYMGSIGKPRQPKTTQARKKGTLRYKQETETWRFTKCDKRYTIQNARSARIHASEHTKAEKKQKEQRGKPDTALRPTKPR